MPLLLQYLQGRNEPAGRAGDDHAADELGRDPARTG